MFATPARSRRFLAFALLGTLCALEPTTAQAAAPATAATATAAPTATVRDTVTLSGEPGNTVSDTAPVLQAAFRVTATRTEGRAVRAITSLPVPSEQDAPVTDAVDAVEPTWPERRTDRPRARSTRLRLPSATSPHLRYHDPMWRSTVRHPLRLGS